MSDSSTRDWRHVQPELVFGRTALNLVDRPSSIVHVLGDSVARWPDATVLADTSTGRVVTYRDFAGLVEGAAALLGKWCHPGDRVAVVARNGLEAAVAIWACARAGMIHVGLPFDLPAAKLSELISLTDPRLVFAQSEFAGVVPGTRDAEELISRVRPWDSDAPVPGQDDVYCLIATSGTTGRSKAVKVTGRMAGHAAAYYGNALTLGPQDCTAIHLSFAWVSGHITQLAPAMYTGGSGVTMATFSPLQLIDVVRRYGVTWLDVVPSIWEGLLRADDFSGDRLPTLRLAVFGGAAAPPGTLHRVRRRVPNLKLYDVYAQSETCAPVTMLFDADAGGHAGTVGRASPFSELRVVDSGGQVVGRGTTGELQIRSGAVTPGYWPPDVAPVDDDGWFHTGDLASIDDDGFVTTHGRSVDLIIRGGRNIYPAEVERALMDSGVLADAAVVGLPSAASGQRVAAAVTPLPGHQISTSDLRQHVARAIGNHAAPKTFQVVDQLPRNRNGKVDRALVQKLFES